MTVRGTRIRYQSLPGAILSQELICGLLSNTLSMLLNTSLKNHRFHKTRRLSDDIFMTSVPKGSQ